MGLRLVAHYLDPVDALIAQSVVDAAGIPCFLHGAQLIAMMPHYTFGFGGFRLVVSELDLGAAVDVLTEATAVPNLDGEIFELRVTVADRIASFVFGWLAGGAMMPVRGGTWRERADEGAGGGSLSR